MFTVCPKCALTLLVTAADLRVAQGFVRCGRCSNVFNALARLSEERPATGTFPTHDAPSAPSTRESPATPPPTQASTPAAHAPPAPSPPAPKPGTPAPQVPAESADLELVPDSALEFDPQSTDVNKVFVETQPDPAWTAATDSFKSLAIASDEAAQDTSGVSAASPEKDESAAQVDVELDADFLSAAVGGSSPKASPNGDGSATAVRAEPKARGPRARQEPSARTAPPSQLQSRTEVRGSERVTTFTRVQTPSAELAPPDVESGTPVLWAAGIAALVLLLLAQIVTHYRNELAANPALNGPLSKLYSALGLPLVPKWDLHAYDVRQLGASVDSVDSATITVRASVKNAAHRAQPLPLLQVILEDRFGNRIAARNVAPVAYLPSSLRVRPDLAPGERVDAEISFVDPGANAVGFEIDACLPEAGGAIACANDR